MHKEILSAKQAGLLGLIKAFRAKFGLVGGTAIALQIGHRRSIDFDLFTNKRFNNAEIRKIITGQGKRISKVIKDERDQYITVVDGVQLTFLHYPFKLSFSKTFDGVIRMPDLLTLAAMKAYALGRRAKWKDYVDLYFIISMHHSVKTIAAKARQIFKSEFNEKNFRLQLNYFQDVNRTENIYYLPSFRISDKQIEDALVMFSLK